MQHARRLNWQKQLLAEAEALQQEAEFPHSPIKQFCSFAARRSVSCARRLSWQKQLLVEAEALQRQVARGP